ncbi:stage III sporulation protein AF [Abyssisolibacter fermentans]|uniref:stage III sporulation protein AF n=1 Tax=Abyssisolibacter fermentans TaxID=1766203 RepID=UPI0008368EFD|nr:stage III sporulation protein AF [Abyssisolibacter fermentans]
MAIALKSWVSNIVFISFFLIILENILPNSSIKRYVKMIVGLLLIIVIIKPITTVIEGDLTFDSNCYKQLNMYAEYNEKNNEEYAQSQKKYIKEVYVNRIKDDITKYVEVNSNYYINDIKLEIEDENTDTVGSIKSLNLKVSNREVEKNKDNKINIEKVNITSVQNKKNIVDKKIKNDALVKGLSENYGIKQSDICIYMNNKDE